MKTKNQNGEIAIESMLVLIPTLFVLIFLIAVGFNFYQQWIVQTTASETAEKIAQTYSLLECDINTGAPTDKDLYEKPLYRYLFTGKREKYESKNRDRAEKYIDEVLERSSFGYANADNTNVSFEVVDDSLARRHVEVVVETKHRIPFSEGFEIFGMDGERTFRATASAECVDLMDYISTINYAKRAKDMLVGDAPVVSSILKALDSWIGVVKTIHDLS